ncbi:MAG TPA: hypothetical protein VMW56_13145 [Candidatus Margulisiibacteriota bacterium]|nr:hypothetical protein [Candidatus Margulisiibacteriota bacterium]
MCPDIPVALFAYNRPDHLTQVLEGLRENAVPLIYAFSDGPRLKQHEGAVSAVRKLLRAIDWCDVIACQRNENLGLGRSVLAGVSDVLRKHEAVIVFEDDLACVHGTYEYLCAALAHYRDDDRVMSVTGWTHPRVTPDDVTTEPYLDGRAECWVWGTWRRAWEGMERDALTLMMDCRRNGIDIHRYGADLPEMAREESRRNIWAVRWLYLHMLRGGLCLRPPWSMVEHIGFDAMATNASDGTMWAHPPLRPCPPMPRAWPTTENPRCGQLWRTAYGGRPGALRRLVRGSRHAVRRILRCGFGQRQQP